MTNKEVLPCEICETTKGWRPLGSKLCNGCWELKTRIEMEPEIARRILAEIDAANDDDDDTNQLAPQMEAMWQFGGLLR